MQTLTIKLFRRVEPPPLYLARDTVMNKYGHTKNKWHRRKHKKIAKKIFGYY